MSTVYKLYCTLHQECFPKSHLRKPDSAPQKAPPPTLQHQCILQALAIAFIPLGTLVGLCVVSSHRKFLKPWVLFSLLFLESLMQALYTRVGYEHSAFFFSLTLESSCP